MVTDAQRRELYHALVRGLGEGPADTMMDLVPAGWSDVATRSDVVELGAELRGEMSELRGDVRAIDARLTGEIAGVRGEIAGVQGEIAALGARLDAQLAKLVVANLATSAAFAGLVFGAVRLAGG